MKSKLTQVLHPNWEVNYVQHIIDTVKQVGRNAIINLLRPHVPEQAATRPYANDFNWCLQEKRTTWYRATPYSKALPTFS